MSHIFHLWSSIFSNWPNLEELARAERKKARKKKRKVEREKKQDKKKSKLMSKLWLNVTLTPATIIANFH